MFFYVVTAACYFIAFLTHEPYGDNLMCDAALVLGTLSLFGALATDHDESKCTGGH